MAKTNSNAGAGKAKRTELQTELIQTAELAYADGEGDGIKQFLEEDIPAVVSRLRGDLL